MRAYVHVHTHIFHSLIHIRIFSIMNSISLVCERNVNEVSRVNGAGSRRDVERVDHWLRPDHSILKTVYKKIGLEKLRSITRLPFVDMRELDFSRSPKVNTDRAFDLLRRLPFNEALYCVTTPGGTCDICISSDTDSTDAYLIGGPGVVGGAIFDTQNLHLTPMESGAVEMGVGVSHDDRLPGYFRQFTVTVASIALAVLDAIDTTNSHLVEVEPTERTKRSLKTSLLKPWLANPPKRVILLDATKARHYGHRIDRGGSHASPAPHQRIGHWATLRHERYGDNRGKRVWVRPAWIGDKEWVFEGNRYKVILPEASQ